MISLTWIKNFAGVIESEISRAILRTLWHSFPQCRVFEDQFGPSGEFQAGSLKNVASITIERGPVIEAYRVSGLCLFCRYFLQMERPKLRNTHKELA